MSMNKTDDSARAQFLACAGWESARLRPLAGDASTRSYMRAEQNGRNAVLMIAPTGAETAPCPVDANDEERRTLGYNAMARLAGPNLHAFIAISKTVRDIGLSAPEVFAADAALGLALIEDLGDNLYTSAVAAVDEATLYTNAIDALLKLRKASPPPPTGNGYIMLSYDALALSAETQLLTEWYWPLKKNSIAPDDLQAEYLDLFQTLIGRLSAPHAIVLRDYHAENLLWLPNRDGAARTGIIDFQDGLYGHGAYDLVSLLEDARRDVSPDLAAAMIERYCDDAAGLDRKAFMSDYAILAAQRNAKILGIFARLTKRDKKMRYLDFLPRVEAHFRRDIAREELAPLRAFFAKHFPDLAP